MIASTDPCRILVLPGTDGSGRLLHSFSAALGTRFPVTVLPYPGDEPLGYEALARRLAPSLPTDQPYLLLGESFGGPLAIMLAATRPPGLVGLVLSASFARYPVRGARAAAVLASIAPVHFFPTAMMSWFLLGAWSTPELLRRTAEAVSAVPAVVIRARIGAALQVDTGPLLKSIDVPLLYLRASRDRVVPRAAARAIIDAAAHASVTDVDGPHFLLQAAPKACADAIRDFVTGLSSRDRRN